jgi:hypothetical protein
MNKKNRNKNIFQFLNWSLFCAMWTHKCAASPNNRDSCAKRQMYPMHAFVTLSPVNNFDVRELKKTWWGELLANTANITFCDFIIFNVCVTFGTDW